MSSKQILACLAVVFVGCGSQPTQTAYEDESKKTSTFTSGGSGAVGTQSLISIPVAVDYGAFGLTAVTATEYSITLDDDPVSDPNGDSTCLSEYTATVTKVASSDELKVYKDDRNCLAKLTSFTHTDGTVYTSTAVGATDFTTWLANDTAIFAKSDDSGDQIRVKVVSQLASPVVGTETIVYNFSELLDGTNDYTFSEASVSDAIAITVESQEAPLFDVIEANYVGMNGVTGAPQFTFKMGCVDDPTHATPTPTGMTDSGDGTDTVCGANSLVDIEYKLVIDSYSSVLTIADAETIFSSAGSTVTIPGDQYQDTVNDEGFNTSTLDGPGPLGVSGNENMILILKAGISYTYYNIDVTTITQ